MGARQCAQEVILDGLDEGSTPGSPTLHEFLPASERGCLAHLPFPAASRGHPAAPVREPDLRNSGTDAARQPSTPTGTRLRGEPQSTEAIASHNRSMFAFVMPATLMRPEPTM